MRQPGRPRLADLTSADLKQRAEEVSQMAASATTPEIRDALERLAKRYEELAEERARDT